MSYFHLHPSNQTLETMDSLAGHHVAEPTPPFSVNGAHHPLYSEMIIAAIAGLNDNNGSSRQAIAKYMEREFSNLPPNHPILLTHHLKRMKEEAELMMIKHSYSLPPPRSVPFETPIAIMDNHFIDHAPETCSITPVRKPGRPPKERPPMFASLGLAKKGRGRPPKKLMSNSKVHLSGNGRPRGRPKRSLSSVPKNNFTKVGSGTAVLVTDPQQLVAYQELKLKYEHLQSKAKEVVDVVRPYINPDYEAFGALQELETLVATYAIVQSEKQLPSYV